MPRLSSTGQTRAELTLDAVTDLVYYLLDLGRENDDELGPGEIEAAIAAGEVSAEHMVTRFAQELDARLEASRGR
jgi:hypothetical protein